MQHDMAFSPRKQVNQHKQTDKETKSQNKPALHRCDGHRDGKCGREEWDSGTGASSWAEAEDRGRKTALWQREKSALPGASSGKIKIGCELPDPVFSVHFLQFHPAILKPDFNLSVREVDAAADL